MSLLALWFAAVGLADLTTGLAGAAVGTARALSAAVVGAVAAAVGALLIGHEIGAVLFAGVVALALLVGWAWLRTGTWTNERVAGALALHATAILVLATLSGTLPEGDGGVFARWLEGLPFVGASTWESGLLVVGIVLWLGATANSIVRMAIFLVEKQIDLRVGEEQLKGGRIIGPLERWLIFSLVLSGNAVAAGFITAAKSLARFPELGRSANIRLDTEYLLVGSLVSWTLALAPLLLVP
ncbi:MAG TPA: hypothetical protein VF058_00660 [Actinomycetota bacterium]